MTFLQSTRSKPAYFSTKAFQKEGKNIIKIQNYRPAHRNYLCVCLYADTNCVSVKKMEETVHWRGPLTRCFNSERTIGGNEGAGRSSERGGLGFRQPREHKLSPPVIAGLLLFPCIFQPPPKVSQSHSLCRLRRGDEVTSNEEKSERKRREEGERAISLECEKWVKID